MHLHHHGGRLSLLDSNSILITNRSLATLTFFERAGDLQDLIFLQGISNRKFNDCPVLISSYSACSGLFCRKSSGVI